MAAGLEALQQLSEGGVYERLEALGARLEQGMKAAAQKAGVPVRFQRIGSMFAGYFTDQPVHNLEEAMTCDLDRFKRYFHGMLDAGIYIAPSQFEAGFISTAHTDDDIDRTVDAAETVLKSL